MKNLTLIFIVLFSFITAFAQKETAPAVEIFFFTVNLPSSPIMTFTMTAQSQCWGITSSHPYPPQSQYYFLTNDYDEDTYVPEYNNMGQNSAGFEFIAHLSGTSPGYPVFAYGLYKVTNNLNNLFFYLDYRDYRAGYYGHYSPPNSIDIWIKYDYTKGYFEYNGTGQAYEFYPIQNGQHLNIWDIKEKGTQLTSLFPDYWENALAGIIQKNPSTGIFEPFIVWGPYNGFQSTDYKIYWRLGGSGNFYYLATVDANTFSYRHNGLAIGSGLVAEYKVQAYNNQSSSGFTNTASINTSGFYKETKNRIDKTISDYLLFQNYPNPFNPATTISYSIPENSFVSLKVYDIIGNVVADLINEDKEAGSYSVSFDASNLSSGLYFYTLRTNGYSFTKKMILIK